MAKLTLLFLLVTLALALLLVTEVQGRKGHRNGWRRKHDMRKQSRYQDDNGREHKRKHSPWHHRRSHNDPLSRYLLFGSRFASSFLPFFNQEDSWWEGPNVCENRTEEIVNNTDSDIHRHFSVNTRICDESETAYKCKTIQENLEVRMEENIILECCNGFSRRKGDFGCPNKVKLDNLLQKAEELGLTEFVKAIKSLELTSLLEKGNFTLFAPENGAFSLDSDLGDIGAGIMLKDEPSVISVSEDAIEKTVKLLRNAILGHVISGSVRSSHMEDEEVLETTNPDYSTIRINHFARPDELMTANCVPVVTRDHMATNGVIHTVSKALKPVSDSLLDMVKKRPELSTLKTVLAAANYVSELDKDGQLTLLAPTNKAFDSMNARLRERLLRGDLNCLQSVLKNHLLPNVICSSAIVGQARTRNQLNHYLNATRTENGKVFINGAQVVLADEMATNGVLHIIDEVLIPREALSVLEVLEDEGFTELLSLIDAAGLTKTLETTSNFTIFAPTNKAIQDLPIAVKTKLTQDPELLVDVLSYHVTPEQSHYFHDNQLLDTLGDEKIRYNNFVLLSIFKQVRTAQCAEIGVMNVQACNGRINVIHEVMMPPRGTVIDVLAMDKRFSTLVKLLKQTGLADELQKDGPYTVFAPNNEAFERLLEINPKILEKSEELKELLLHHVYHDNLCCNGIFKSWFSHKPAIPTMNGDRLSVYRSHKGPVVDGVNIIKCDQTATNGNVMEVEDVLEIHLRRRDFPFYRSVPSFFRGIFDH